MAFVITAQQINTYQEGIDAIINQLGKSIKIINDPVETICPNCYYDSNTKRSSGRYKSDNPETLNGPLHKPFVDGQRCPVCKGRGKLTETPNETEIKATIKWNPKEDIINDDGTRVALPDGICRIKTFVTNYNKIKNAKEFQVAFNEPTQGSPEYISCYLFRQPVPRGLKYNRYLEAWLKIK
jgi:hypothetical protein